MGSHHHSRSATPPKTALQRWRATVTLTVSLMTYRSDPALAAAGTHVAKVQRAGVLPEQIYLEYSTTGLRASELQPTKIKDILSARNVTAPGGQSETQTTNVLVDPTAEFKSAQEIGECAGCDILNRGACIFARLRECFARRIRPRSVT